MHAIAHFRTITAHRALVRRYCFRLGLVWQGLTHDLSKYAPVEFWRGAKYYQGDRSPNDAERRDTGLSLAWLHHKGRNRHHFEYWVDYRRNEAGELLFDGNPMPMRYVAEMFCDRLAASRIYLGERYTDEAPYRYFVASRDRIPMHEQTKREIEEMLRVLKDEGEAAAFARVRKRLREKA